MAGRPSRNRRHISLTVAPETYETLRRLAYERHIPQGDVIDAAVQELAKMKVRLTGRRNMGENEWREIIQKPALQEGTLPEVGMIVYVVEVTHNIPGGKTTTHVYAEPQRTNLGNQPIEKGWLGETNNRSKHAMGAYRIESIDEDVLSLVPVPA